MSKRERKPRKNAGAGYGYMFSGAFAKKADAVKKEKQRKGSFVKAVFLPTGMRYAVMTPRDNPVKRKKKATKAETLKKRLAAEQEHLKQHEYAARIRGNPMDLVVMGANPSGGKEIVVQPGERITIRVNPEPNPYLGFGPGQSTKQELAGSRRSFKANVRRKVGEEHEYIRGLRQSARRSKGQGKLDKLFHEVYGPGENPAPICGKSIGGYVCSRKPGHRGPHLPQGATMRTRHRLRKGWQPNPTAGALREKFTGMPVDLVSVHTEALMPPGDYAMLGKEISLYIKPRKGGQVLKVQLLRTVAVADESARQIYFVGGDQDVSAGLHTFGALDRGAGLFELGEARRIDYTQRKEHVTHPEMDAWRHSFGEETEEYPTVLFDANHKRLLLEGGAYEIRPEGIVN